MANLDTDGLYPMTWDSCDGCDCTSLLGSPQDARGRGILLTITRDGETVDLSDESYHLYFLWLHRQQHSRGCVEMTAMDASAGKFSVYFPSGMAGYEGEAVCSIVLSWGDKTLATPTFDVCIDEALVSTLSIEDGFTLFSGALKAYEAGTADLLALVADLTTMRDSGEFDGKDGTDGAQGPQGPKGDSLSFDDLTGEQKAALKGEKGDTGETGPAGPRGDTGSSGADGKDGVSCTHSWDGTVLTVTSASGTSAADLIGPQGAKGETGATGAKGEQGPKGDALTFDELTDEQKAALRGEKGDKGETGATGPKGDKGDSFTYSDFTAEQLAGLKGPKGDTGDTGPHGEAGPTGPQGPKGDAGDAGKDGADGVSCTHSWDGTVLTVTSASGTSSADLVGPQGPRGDTGDTGPQGPQGEKGDTPDLSAYATQSWVKSYLADISAVSF